MHPKKILFFIIGALITLFTMTLFSSYYITNSGTTREGISPSNTMLRYPTPDILGVLFKLKEKENDKLDELVKEANTVVDERTDKLATNDTITNGSLHKLGTNVEGKVYYPGNRIDYIRRLKNKPRQGVCQAVHYGGPQIEGDRITGYARNRLQPASNGGGPGFFLIKVMYNQNSMDIATSGNWVRYVLFDRRQRCKAGHNMYGPLITYSRFINYAKDATGLSASKASFTIELSAKSYTRLQHYIRFGLYHSNAIGKVKIKIYENDDVIKVDSLTSNGKYHNYKLNFAITPEELEIKLKTRVSLDFYGIILNADTGVRMDNVAMRGETGCIFIRMSYENYRQISVDCQPDLFISQYGGNTTPYMKIDQQLRECVEGLIFDMRWVKRANSNVMFMLLDPGDMTTSHNGQRLTYPLLPKLNDLAKEECTKNDVVYFGVYEAIGGENSMIPWVKQGMVVSDYIHFSPRGIELISEMFYQYLHSDSVSVE